MLININKRFGFVWNVGDENRNIKIGVRCAKGDHWGEKSWKEGRKDEWKNQRKVVEEVIEKKKKKKSEKRKQMKEEEKRVRNGNS